MHKLSVLMVYRNETPHLREFIEYHRLIGVEHFYLANNDDDPTEAYKILADYKDVTSIHVPINDSVQCSLYKRMCDLLVTHTEWLAVIDSDEFIYPMSCDDMRVILDDYKDFSGLVLNWAMYGTSGCVSRPKLVIEANVHRAEQHSGFNTHVKSIVKPEFVDSWITPHSPVYNQGFAVNENKIAVDGPFNNPITTIKARINHHYVRSVENWNEKLARKRFDRTEYSPASLHIGLDQVYDPNRFIDRLKKAMNNIGSS